MSYLKCLDLLAGLIAILLPTLFVEGAHRTLNAFGPVELPISISYGLVLVIFSMIFSLTRKSTRKSDGDSNSRGRQIALGVTVLVVGTLMFKNAGMASSAAMQASDVVSPYLGYLISVLFCMGVGYVLADLIFATFNLFRRK